MVYTARWIVAVFALLMLLFASSCGKATETETETDTQTEAVTETTENETDGQGSESESESDFAVTDIVTGAPIEDFELPAEAEGIVGMWRLGGEEGASAENPEIWDFGADGSFRMYNVDQNGKPVTNEITGQYRIKGSKITVTMMGMPLEYTYSFKDEALILTDHGTDTVLEHYKVVVG